MLGLRFCKRAFSSCSERGPLFIAVRGPLTIAASLVAEHRLQTHRLSSCGSRVQLLHGMWDLPRPGLEPVSPALAGRFSTTAPQGKPSFLKIRFHIWVTSWYLSFSVWLTSLSIIISRSTHKLNLFSIHNTNTWKYLFPMSSNSVCFQTFVFFSI